MASNLRGYSADEVLNKVLNTSNDSIQVDIVAGAEYAEDAAHTDEDTGNFVLGVRNDTLAALGGTDGDYVPFQMNASGALYVEVSSSSGDDSIYVDDADWTDSTSKHTLVGGLYQSSPQSITDGDVGPFQVDADGALHISDGGNTITVDGTVTANLGTTDNAVLDAVAASLSVLDDWDDSNYANVNANIAGTDIVGGAGAVASGVQRVTLASDDPAVTSLGNLDNAVDGNYLNVNMNLDGSDAQAGEGAISATTQRVTIATDDDGVAHLATIAGAVSTQMQVDIVADGAGLATSANQLADGHNVTIDNSSGGSAVNIQDGGNTITVDGTVTANLSATDNAVLDTIDAVLDTIKTDTGTIDSDTDAIKTAVEAVNQAAEGAISATTQRVTIATDDDGVAHLATIAGDTTSVDGKITACNTGAVVLAASDGTDIGDVDVASLPASTNTLEVVGDAAENAAAAGNPVLTGGRYDSPGNDNATVRALGDNDVGALALDPTGALYVREYLGQTGSCFVSGTSAVTAAIGKFVAIQFLEDTVFNSTDGLVATDTGRWPDDSGAASDISSSNTAAVGSQVFPQGMTIFGRWDSFILVSGAVIAYVGNV